MRDTFVGDVSDFLKYGLLNVLVGNDLRLGVVWYLNPDTKQLPLDLERHHPFLYQQLLKIRESRHGTRAIEDTDILPPHTMYHDTPVPLPLPRKGRANAARAARTTERAEWLVSALRSLEAAELVFFDPDSGLGDMSNVKVTETRARKFAFLHEAVPFLHRGQSVVIFHYLGMRESAEKQMRRAIVRANDTGHTDAFAVQFRRGRGPRCMLVLPATARMKVRLLWRVLGSTAVMGGSWYGCWTVLDPKQTNVLDPKLNFDFGVEA